MTPTHQANEKIPHDSGKERLRHNPTVDHPAAQGQEETDTPELLPKEPRVWSPLAPELLRPAAER